MIGLIFAACAGLLAGAIARMFYPGGQDMSWLKTMLLGLGGGFLAGLLGRLTGWYGPGQGAGLIASVLGAMLILWLLGKRNRVT
jgi:uncharacterized membrane protein YeaQ/YmgE (transglycosylase-associated protein family)